MTTTDTFSSALASWHEAIDAGPQPALARTLLTAAESRLAADLEQVGADRGEAVQTELGRVEVEPVTRRLWHTFLEETSVPPFLSALAEPDARRRWAEITFDAIRLSGYTLEVMLDHRRRTISNQSLLEEFGRTPPVRWSYANVRRRARRFAATFLRARQSEARVALFVDNCVDGACCDLACLLHDILVTPLNVHFNIDELVWVFNRLRISVAVADTEERQWRLLEVRRRADHPFVLFALQPSRAVEQGEAQLLPEAITHLTPDLTEATLAARPRRRLDDVCTVMFTSGSTGRPKGVAFTQFNLISKRFARAAALPHVGDREVLLCYLPLYHTFGRYLELLGMLFWRGTYVFAGNPSAGTLLAGLKEVQPTGLIGIPLRWQQIRDQCMERLLEAGTQIERDAAFRQVVGQRLRWGLSAAGHLDPKVFQFFQRRGVDLCSGFGMTEATGGITMSPPGDYIPGTVGTTLPGMRLRFTDQGEMQIDGVYVARYLADEGHDLEVAQAEIQDDGDWLPTGDLFKELERGHLTIVDRIKDIYKNDRGQTVAPRRVEQRFEGVPGIKRTFLVGDNRSYNVLLIVPDDDDPVLEQALSDESRREYFNQIIAAANHDLAPYERVINFALLERDFDLERGELTPKGTFRRKTIADNFADQINGLYRQSYVELGVRGLRVRVPRWFYRDLAILEDDITATDRGLIDRRRGLELEVLRVAGGSTICVGDLEYTILGDTIDLGLFARQPRLWIGNPSLIEFSPCKEGWDTPLGTVSPNALLPRDIQRHAQALILNPTGVGDARLMVVNRLIQIALFSPAEKALAALMQLKRELLATDDKFGSTVRLRITALARHDEEEVRCLAYRVLLLDDPVPDRDLAFPAFIQSGLSFLNEDSLRYLSTARFETRRLEALRRRFCSYRAQLEWPANATVRRQFEYTLRMLVNFVHQNPEFYKAVRVELASWALHHQDPALADFAQALLEDLVAWYEHRLQENSAQLAPERLDGMISFDDDIPESARKRLRHVLLDTTFLKQSIILTYYEEHFDLEQVPPGGIWVSRLRTRGMHILDRVSVNTVTGRHFDLLVIQRSDMDGEAVRTTNYWLAAIAGYPFGPRILPRFGCCRPELAAMSLEYVTEPTVEEKIREFASLSQSGGEAVPNALRKLIVRAMATIFLVWRNSGCQVVPGSINPANVVVPERDYHEGSLMLSLAGWEEYRNTLSLFLPLYNMFYGRMRAHYPNIAEQLSYEWMFDACVEALGGEQGLEVLRQFRTEIERAGTGTFDAAFIRQFDSYLSTFDQRYHMPLSLANAIDRYHDWMRHNPGVTREACTDHVAGLVRLYRLDRFGEIARYHLYRHTFFAAAGPLVQETFDRLLEVLLEGNKGSATQMVELSDLQATLTSTEDLDVFSRLVFPQVHRPQRLEVITFGDSERKQVTVRTSILDTRGDSYDVREPVDAEEVGQLYRLFFEERFPKTISELDRYLIATDAADRVIGGICYQVQERGVVHMEGVVTNSSYTGRGIATRLLEDFVTRQASQGAKVVKTGFIMREFCEKRGFRLDRRWGGLVRVLTDGELSTERQFDLV